MKDVCGFLDYKNVQSVGELVPAKVAQAQQKRQSKKVPEDLNLRFGNH